MSIIEDMYSACTAWLNDWVTANPPEQLLDRYDLEQWMNTEMVDAIQICITSLFIKPETRIDAIEVLRSLCWNYYKSRQSIAISSITPSFEHVTRVKGLPQTAQKTSEWMREAYNLLTGHEFSEVVYGSPAARMRVIQKKCNPISDSSIDNQICFKTPIDGKLTPFQWGWRFEPVVRMIFEATGAEGPIDDSLGRIRHPTLPRLAASPDGIITSGPRVGRLVEIKSPISRTLTKKIPQEYWCQMQLQAEVCNVDAVEYIEIRIGLGPPPTLYSYSYVGVVCVVGTDPASYTYVYSPLLKSFDDYTPPADAVEVCQWHIVDMYTETVLRNHVWWKEVGYHAYTSFWNDVEEQRKKPKASECLIVDD